MTDHTSRPSAEDTEALETLRRLRGSIDNIDAELDPEFAQKWFTFVVAEVIRHHVEAAEEL